MTAHSRAQWKLVREFGLEYPGSTCSREELGLNRVTVADYLSGGGYLLVDGHPVPGMPGKGVSRTLILTQSRTVVYDSLSQGAGDEYACRMDERGVAILCRSRRAIKVVSTNGTFVRDLALPATRAGEPRLVSWTHRETFLVTFSMSGKPVDIVEFDTRGHVLWSTSVQTTPAGFIGSIQLLASGSILITNVGYHVVEEVKPDGLQVVRWGKRGSPSRLHGQLCNPMWARELDDGTLLIADSYNQRCLAIDAEGATSTIFGNDHCLFLPSCITCGVDGNYLIGDWGLRCVYELDDAQQVVWREGRAVPRKRHLSFPRSVPYVGGDRYLIADTSHNRIVDYNGGQVSEIKVRENVGFAWPRAAYRTSRGSLIVADGLNSRVLEVTMQGKMLRELHDARFRGKTIALRDPHDVRELPNGNLLLTDSAQDLVLELDWNGQVAWAIGNDRDGTLDDPHSAQLIPDGRIMISDCGHHRILFANPATREMQSLSSCIVDDKEIRLTFPRYADFAEDGTLAIADTFNNRVLAVDPDGVVLWILSDIPNSPISTLQHPRWVHLMSRNEIVISDHFNHRILHLRRHVE